MYIKKSNFLFKLIMILFFELVVSACEYKSAVKETLQGEWVIDSIFYNNKDIKSCLGINSLFFRDDSLHLPTIFSCYDIKRQKRTIGTWKINKNENLKGLKMAIMSNNLVLSDTYVIKFQIDNKKKLLYMLMISKDKYIKCGKASYNIEVNKDFVEKLVKMTN